MKTPSAIRSPLTNIPQHPSNPNHPSPGSPTATEKIKNKCRPYSQPRFKLHSTPNLPTSRLDRQLENSANAQHPNCPQLCLEQPLPPTNPANSHSISLNPFSHLACTDTTIAAASPTLLTTWRLRPTYPSSSPTATPFCILQAQWHAPSDYHITALSITPDSHALALSLQHSDPPRAQNTIAVVVLDPRTCARRIRLSIPASLVFMPHPTTPPSTTLSLAFFTCSRSSSHLPDILLSRGSDLPPHLRYTFHQCETDDIFRAEFIPAFGPSVPLAKYGLAVAGSNGLVAVYRFTAGYERIFKYKPIDGVDLFNSDTPLRMSTVVQVMSAGPQRLSEENGHRETVMRNRLLALCNSKGVAVFEDGVPAMQMNPECFRPISVCAFHRRASGEMDAVLLVCREAGGTVGASHRSTRKRAGEKDARVAFALKSAKGLWKFVPVHNVKEADITDIQVVEEDAEVLTIIVLCAAKSVLQYRIAVQKNGALRVTPIDTYNGFRRLLEKESANTNRIFIRRPDHVVEVRARGEDLLVNAFGYPRDATASY